jgi:hypothetical protein
MAITITISQEQRDVLRYRVSHDATDLEGLECALDLDRTDREEAIKWHDCATLWIGLLDQIGWQETADRASYQLQIDGAALSCWLTRAIGELDETVRSDRIQWTAEDLGVVRRERSVLASILDGLAVPEAVA